MSDQEDITIGIVFTVGFVLCGVIVCWTSRKIRTPPPSEPFVTDDPV